MGAPIPFYFDFASPYAWFSLEHVETLAAKASRDLDWRPILVWAILKAHGVRSPWEVPQRSAYLLADMVRSAAFYGVKYRPHVRLPISAHKAARVYYHLTERDEVRARRFGRDVFSALFVDGADITDPATLGQVAGRHGLAADEIEEAMNGPVGRARLAAAIDAAVRSGVIGSPFFIVDGEGFFGADRVPQIAWRLGLESWHSAEAARRRAS
jgi:2-hydroxychromene-2-carboxylate isomerase